jgi:hypothetical protein
MADIGFKSSLSVNDGPSNAQQLFDKAVMFTIPDRTTKNRDVVTHDQTDDAIGKEPGLKEYATIKAEIEYSPQRMARIEALFGVRNKDFILGTPPNAGSSTPRQTFPINGFVTKIGEVKLGTQDDMIIPFEIQPHRGFQSAALAAMFRPPVSENDGGELPSAAVREGQGLSDCGAPGATE